MNRSNDLENAGGLAVIETIITHPTIKVRHDVPSQIFTDGKILDMQGNGLTKEISQPINNLLHKNTVLQTLNLRYDTITY